MAIKLLFEIEGKRRWTGHGEPQTMTLLLLDFRSHRMNYFLC